MRAIHLTDGTAWGGIEAHLLALLTAARARPDGPSFEFWFSAPCDTADRFRRAGATVHADFQGWGQRILGLRSRLRAANDLLVHCHGYLAVHWAAAANLGISVPMVVTLHAHVDELARPWHRPWWYNRSARLAALLSRARFIAVCDSVRADYVRRGLPAHRISVVHNGIPPEWPEPEATHWRSDLPTLVHIGRLVPVKRPQIFLEAFAPVAAVFPDLRAVVVGDGPLRPALESRARELGVRDRVEFVGWQPDPVPFLGGSSILVVTSRSEGAPYSVLEAMRAGTPVVAPAVGGLPELIRHGENGLLVPVDDIAAFSAAVRELVLDAALRQTIATGGKRSVQEELSADRMLARTLRVYSLLGTCLPAAGPRV